MASVDYYLSYFQNGLAELEDFLLAKDLFRTIHASPPAGEGPFPSFTLGGMLFARACLAGMRLTLSQQDELGSARLAFEQLRSRWLTAWRTKTAKEVHWRLNQWSNFLADFSEHPAANVDRYHTEVRNRLMLDLLIPEASQRQEELEQALQNLASLHRAYFESGKFVWADELRPAFPEPSYWYLYGMLSTKTSRRNE